MLRVPRACRTRSPGAFERPPPSGAKVEWDQDANMIDSFCNRALGRMTRRELLNIAWKLGAAAIAQPIVSSRVLAQPLFRTYPFSLGVASGDPLPDGVVLWTRLAPKPLEGGGMPMANVDVDWEIARDRAFRTIVRRRAPRSRGRSSGTASTSRSPGSSRRASTGTAFAPATRSARSAAPGPRRRPARRSIACASRSAAASTTRTATSPPSDASPTSSSTSCSTPATTSTKGAPTAARTERRVRQHNGDEIYTLVDYRNRYALYKSDRDLTRRARLGAVDRHLGRSRGRQQLRRRLRRERHAAGDLPAAPRRRVPGLLRDDAAARRRAAARAATCGCTGGCSSAT